MKNAVGYVRVSTEAQAGEDRYGEEAQKVAIREWAAENGYEIVRWYVDEASGVCENPPMLTEILFGEEMQNPPYEAVIAFKSDRIARDTKLYFYRLYVLERKGIHLFSTQEEFRDDDPFANMLRAMMMFSAEQERKNITLRTRNGRKVKASKGGYSGGKVPYGYRAEGKRYVVEPAEAAVVKLIFREYDRGMSAHGIAVMLNNEGVMKRNGSEWQTSGILSVVNNRKTYEGYYRYGEDQVWVNGEHEPILRKAE